MFRDHLVGDEDVADKEYAPSREQRISPYHHLRRYRVCVLLMLAISTAKTNRHRVASALANWGCSFGPRPERVPGD